MRLYLDANALIFGDEGPAKVRHQVFGWIDRFEATPDGMAITSRLSRLECRVKPTRLGDAPHWHASTQSSTPQPLDR